MHISQLKIQKRKQAIVPVAVLLGCILLTGCQQVKEHFNRVRPNNPVVGPAPPRTSLEEASVDALGYANISKDAKVVSGVLPVSHNQIGELSLISDSQIVAMVNGNPILAGDLFAPYTKQIGMMKKQLKPEQFAQAQRELLRRDLPDAVRRKLFAHAMKASLKQEQVDQLDTILDEAFGEHVLRLLEKTKTASAQELEMKLNSEGISLEQLRKTFGEQQLASQYLATESDVRVQTGRVDLLNYYQENIDKYSHPAQVKWQEIRITFSANNGREGAIEKLNAAVQQLEQGTDFGDVARKYSNGLTAEDGGQWEWTRQGSLADSKIDQLLFSMNKDQISGVLESPGYFQVVKLTQRKDAGAIPFEEIQNKIRTLIIKQKRKEKKAEVIANLKASADIETIFDDDPKAYAAMRDLEKY